MSVLEISAYEAAVECRDLATRITSYSLIRRLDQRGPEPSNVRYKLPKNCQKCQEFTLLIAEILSEYTIMLPIPYGRGIIK